MHVLRKTAVAVGAVGALMTSGAVVATSASASTSGAACPPGYACIFTGSSALKWKTYGSHNLSNVDGVHAFLNNQTGGAVAYLCTGYNGNGSCQLVRDYVVRDFTPINSVYLSARPI